MTSERPSFSILSKDARTTPLDEAAPAVSELLVIVGSGHLITHPLGSAPVLIGRAAECDVVIDHRALSRQHAILERSPSLTIKDLGSTNGIRLARGIVRGGDPVPLAAGESFHIGPFACMVVSADTSEASTERTGRELLRVEDPTASGVSPLIGEIARSDVNVLIQGETGVGKEVLASTLHELSGRTGPLSSVNCAVLSEPLLESELFGHEKGAFTGAVGLKQGLLEASSGGTVFLDEIGELPLSLQAKLLRAVQSREVRRIGSTRSVPIDVRFIAATNRELATEVAEGRFRQDLFSPTRRRTPAFHRSASAATRSARSRCSSSRMRPSAWAAKTCAYRPSCSSHSPSTNGPATCASSRR